MRHGEEAGGGAGAGTESGVTDLVYYDGYLYLGTKTHGVHMADVHDPLAPVMAPDRVVGRYDVSRPESVFCAGDLSWAARNVQDIAFSRDAIVGAASQEPTAPCAWRQRWVASRLLDLVRARRMRLEGAAAQAAAVPPRRQPMRMQTERDAIGYRRARSESGRERGKE
jgi:hypothetical protein